MRVNWVGMYMLVWREVERFFRVAVQALLAPWISALLYIFVFGFIVGGRIDTIAGAPYIDFVLPGILMMSVISSAFSQTSFSLYIQRFTRSIEEILITPFSHVEMIIGCVVSGIARGVLVGLGVFLIAVFFNAANIAHFGLFIFYLLSVSVVFSLLGLLVSVWADNFEHLNIWTVFVITPLSFLGGVFNSITMLPPFLQTVVRLNPFFYFIDGVRYSMIGVHEASALLGFGIIFSLIIFLSFAVYILFRKGYGLRQ
ncbi:MAG: ABC transporter permease [bacterium]|nr:ABC transporter permease [bacterium]